MQKTTNEIGNEIKFATSSTLTIAEQRLRVEEMLRKKQEQLFDIDVELLYIYREVVPSMEAQLREMHQRYAVQVAEASRQAKRRLEQKPNRDIGKLELEAAAKKINNAPVEFEQAKAKVQRYIKMLEELIASLTE